MLKAKVIPSDFNIEPDSLNINQEVIQSLSSQQNKKLESLITETFQKKGYGFDSLVDFEKFLILKCKVKSYRNINTLYVDNQAICEWSFVDNPVEIIEGPFKTKIETNFYFREF